MEKVLQKIARQINALDEGELKQYWNKYLNRIQNFDASPEWEEACIILSLIQAVSGKNLMFRARLAELDAEITDESTYKKPLLWRSSLPDSDDSLPYNKPRRRAIVLDFKAQNTS